MEKKGKSRDKKKENKKEKNEKSVDKSVVDGPKQVESKESEERVQSIDEILNSFIDGKKDVEEKESEKIMAKCANQAKEIRDNINMVLQRREELHESSDVTGSGNGEEGANLGEKASNSLDVQAMLEGNIMEKIVGLQESLKVENQILEKQTKGEDNNIAELIENEKKENDIANANTLIEACAAVEKSEEVNLNVNVNVNEGIVDAKTNTQEQVTTKAKEDKEDKAIEGKANKKQAKSLTKKIDHKEKVSEEQLTKKLTSFANDQERINYLKGKYMEVSEDNRTLTASVKHNEKNEQQMKKEKDQLQSEYNRMVLAKSRLEGLCREFQKQNKTIREESLLKIKAEEDRRKEIANKFQSTLSDIMQLIQENQKRNGQLKEENRDLASKLKMLLNHYENWEKHTNQIFKQMELESQLVKAKYAKTNVLLTQEKDLYVKEKEQLIALVTDLQKRCANLSASELHLRTELSVYTSKYQEFQDVLSKSNDTFSLFKKDIEKMSKQIKRLEKETAQWKSKWENSNRSLTALSEEKQKRDTELLNGLQKIQKLEKLCRALQDERTEMQEVIRQLKETTSSEVDWVDVKVADS